MFLPNIFVARGDARHDTWKYIYDELVGNHDFNKDTKIIKDDEIKDLKDKNKNKKYFPTTSTQEIRTLCTQTKETQRPNIFVENDIFLLPHTNESRYLIKGNGYFNFDQKELENLESKKFPSELTSNFITNKIGSSEANAIDNAFNSGLLNKFYKLDKEELFLTSRGRHYESLKFEFDKYALECDGIQFEPDAIYEGEKHIIILEAKTDNKFNNYIIRQLFFPYHIVKNQMDELIKKKEIQKAKTIKCLFLFAQKTKKDEDFTYTFIDIKFPDHKKMAYEIGEKRRFIIS